MTFLWQEKYDTMNKALTEVIPELNYTRTNPSIIRTLNGYRTLVRTVNYYIKNDHDYVSRSPFGIFHTQNFNVEWSKDWELLSCESLKDKSNRIINNVFIQGLEDPRIFQVNDKYYFTATTAESNSQGMPETSLLTWDPETSTINKGIPLCPRFQETGRKEKNWGPFEYQGNICMIFNHHPVQIHKINPETGSFDIIATGSSPSLAFSFRGSTNPIPYKEGFLYLIHEVKYHPKWLYSHRWIQLDDKFNMVSISKPFFFIHEGIEFACGLCYDHNEEYVWVTYGVRDAEAYRMQIKMTDIEKELESCF